MSVLFVSLLLVRFCLGDFDELMEKITSQTISFFNFAVQNEEPLHEQMHLEVTYFLYHKDELQKPNQLFVGNINSLRKSGFNIDLPTIMLIHGYTDNKERKILVHLRNSLLYNLDVNLIMVDWSRAAKQIYSTATKNTYYVGREVGVFLRFLERRKFNLGSVHLIGHSLGAHIAGVAGDAVDGRVGRITGLDPAGPLFDFLNEKNDSLSLSSGDGQFVDVIHSAIGTFGITRPIGHADFYPNDGLAPQPGCTNIVLAVTCSHIKSIDYYVESLNGTAKFLSKKCLGWKNDTLLDCVRDDLVPMGYYTPYSARGNFYVQTNPKPPLAMDGKFYKRVHLLD